MMAQTPSSNPTRTPPRCLHEMQATPRGPQALASLALPRQGGRPSGAQERGRNCVISRVLIWYQRTSLSS